jgi:hypothetical protein
MHTREYVNLIPVEVFEPVKDKAVEWFKTRGISQQTLDDLMLQRVKSLCLKQDRKKTLYNLIILWVMSLLI